MEEYINKQTEKDIVSLLEIRPVWCVNVVDRGERKDYENQI